MKSFFQKTTTFLPLPWLLSEGVLFHRLLLCMGKYRFLWGKGGNSWGCVGGNLRENMIPSNQTQKGGENVC